MANSHDGNGKKISQVITYISTDNIIELNQLIYAGAKLVCEKIGILSKSMKKKSKPGWEIRLETQLKKSTKTGQNEKNMREHVETKRKRQLKKKIIQLEEINQKVLAKEGRLKRYRQRVKQHRQNRTFPNNERKFYQKMWGDDMKTYQQPDARETEQF